MESEFQRRKGRCAISLSAPPADALSLYLACHCCQQWWNSSVKRFCMLWLSSILWISSSISRVSSQRAQPDQIQHPRERLQLVAGGGTPIYFHSTHHSTRPNALLHMPFYLDEITKDKIIPSLRSLKSQNIPSSPAASRRNTWTMTTGSMRRHSASYRVERQRAATRTTAHQYGHIERYTSAPYSRGGSKTTCVTFFVPLHSRWSQKTASRVFQ